MVCSVMLHMVPPAPDVRRFTVQRAVPVDSARTAPSVLPRADLLVIRPSAAEGPPRRAGRPTTIFRSSPMAADRARSTSPARTTTPATGPATTFAGLGLPDAV